MSNSEFESLVAGYLEGTATQVQVVRLRDAIKSSPAMQQRFHSRLRLHQAQLSVLRRREDSSFRSAMLWLQGFAQRSGRSFAHLCLLALVFVELRVTIPAEYSGLLFYVEAAGIEEPSAEEQEMPLIAFVDNGLEFEVSMGAEMPDMTIPSLVMPDIVTPADEPTVNEA